MNRYYALAIAAMVVIVGKAVLFVARLLGGGQ